MAAADFENELRLGGAGEIHQWAGRLVREVDIVGTREQRCLPACLVTAATTIGAADVGPEIGLERQHVGIDGRGAAVAGGAAGAATGTCAGARTWARSRT